MTNIVTSVLLIFFAAFSRLLPHPENFAPVAAVAIFAGLYMNNRFAIIIPIAATFLSDIFIGLYPYVLWVYGTYLLIVLVNIGLKKRYNSLSGVKKAGLLYGSTLASSIIFFLVTNFGVWTSGLYYEMSFNGLLASYTAAIPFFRTSLLADVVYVSLMVGVFSLVTKLSKQPVLQGSKAVK
jgi:hypothetical protein